MNPDRVGSAHDQPDVFIVIIEIPVNADPIKQEADMETGGDDKLLAVLVDQVCGLYRNTKITMRPA